MILNSNLSLLKQELKDSQVVALFNSKRTDAEFRIIYNTIDNDLYLKHQELPERFSELIPLESDAADEILQTVVQGLAVINYLVILADEKVPFSATVQPKIQVISHEE